MKKPRIAACFITLAMMLWAVHPMALADEINWLTPGQTAPEPEEETRAVDESVWASPDAASDSGSEGTPEPDDIWLNPGETPDVQDEAPEPEEDDKWLNPGEVPVEEEPEPEKEEWLTPDQFAEVEEEPEPEPEDEPEWLTPDAVSDVEEEPEPEEPEEEEEWLTREEPGEPEEPEPEKPEPEKPEPEEPKPEETKPEEAEKPDGGAMIEVSVPVSGNVVINPHRLPVNIGGEVVRDQIVNNRQLLVNCSDVPIMVSASVTVNTEESGGLKVTDRPIGEDETEKLAYLYVEFQNMTDLDTEAEWSEGYTGAGNQILAADGRAVTADVLRVEAGQEIPVYAAYRLFGSLTENPEAGWTYGDKLSVTVSFAFRPAEETEENPENPGDETPAEPDGSKTILEGTVELEEKADAKPEETPEATEEPKPEPAPVPEPEPEPEWLTPPEGN